MYLNIFSQMGIKSSNMILLANIYLILKYNIITYLLSIGNLDASTLATYVSWTFSKIDGLSLCRLNWYTSDVKSGLGSGFGEGVAGPGFIASSEPVSCDQRLRSGRFWSANCFINYSQSIINVKVCSDVSSMNVFRCNFTVYSLYIRITHIINLTFLYNFVITSKPK